LISADEKRIKNLVTINEKQESPKLKEIPILNKDVPKMQKTSKITVIPFIPKSLVERRKSFTTILDSSFSSEGSPIQPLKGSKL
jgi:hypothetical protein